MFTHALLSYVCCQYSSALVRQEEYDQGCKYIVNHVGKWEDLFIFMASSASLA